MTTKVLTAHVPLLLAEKVDLIAARLERSRGWIVKQALTAWVDQEEERLLLTLQAMADVDAGNVIDHQSVQACAKNVALRAMFSLGPRLRGDDASPSCALNSRGRAALPLGGGTSSSEGDASSPRRRGPSENKARSASA
jgi:predicted transcriptional regulator